MTQPIDTIAIRSSFQSAPKPADIVRAYQSHFRNVSTGALPIAYAFTLPAVRFGEHHVLTFWEGSRLHVTVLNRNTALYGAVLEPEHGTCHVVNGPDLRIALKWPHGKGIDVQRGSLAASAITRGRNLARAFAEALAQARTDLERRRPLIAALEATKPRLS